MEAEAAESAGEAELVKTAQLAEAVDSSEAAEAAPLAEAAVGKPARRRVLSRAKPFRYPVRSLQPRDQDLPSVSRLMGIGFCSPPPRAAVACVRRVFVSETVRSRLASG